MANVTRIKASDPGKKPEALDKPEAPEPKKVVKAKPATEIKKPISSEKPEQTAKAKQKAAKAEKKADKQAALGAKQGKNSDKKPFILFRPFVAFGRYLRDSWREIRQVRWPNRKATWKMVLAVIIYTAMFMLLISLLDLFFTWLFSLILGN